MVPHSQHSSPASPQSSQQDEPLLPQSPESLSQSEVLPSPYPSAVTIDTSELVHPATLHLKPVTWESFAQINFPEGERFEIVDGLLVWLTMGNGTGKHQNIIGALVRFVNQLHSWWAVSGLNVEVESISGNSQAANLRIPDVIITRRRPGSPSASSSGSDQTPKKHVLLTKDKPAYAQIEVTSESTRATDLTAKWQQYCQTGVKFYYIIDLYALQTSGVARVIVGSKERMQGWTRCDNGYPDEVSSSSTSNAQTRRNSYYKKLYTGNDQVNIGVFQDQQLTASQLMSSTMLNQKAEEIKQRYDYLYLSQRYENLSRDNATKDRTIMELRAELPHSRGSSSKSRPDMERKKQKHRSSSSSHTQSTGSQTTSPTNSPERKRHKRKK